MNSIGDYLKLVPPYNSTQPDFNSVISTLLEPIIAAREFTAHLPQDFDLDEAVGAQLDVVGEWVGRTRFVSVPIADLYFSFDDPLRGFDMAVWKGPYDTSYGVTALDDDTYRKLLYAKIALNNWDGLPGTAISALNGFFSSAGSLFFLEDRGDMSMTLGVAQKVPSLLLLSIFARGYIPFRPGGVKAYYRVVSVTQTSMFGFDMNNNYVKGFDTGSWGVDPNYMVDKTNASQFDFSNPAYSGLMGTI